MSFQRPLAGLLAVLAAAALAGCNLNDPAADPTPGDTTPAANEQPTAGGGDQPLAGPPRSAEEALRAFSAAWSNWSFDTRPERFRTLGTIAGGDLAEQLQRDARDAAIAKLESVSNTRQSGRTLGILPDGDRHLVVVHESAIVDGQPAQSRYAIYRADVEQDGNDWKVTAWSPVM